LSSCWRYQAAADEIIHIEESVSEARSSRRKLTIPVYSESLLNLILALGFVYHFECQASTTTDAQLFRALLTSALLCAHHPLTVVPAMTFESPMFAETNGCV
jgi:hypothetical protein